MTWKKELEPETRRKYTVIEVPHELRVDPKVVRDALSALGEYTDSTRKKAIEEPVRKRICTYLGVDYEAPAVHTASPWRNRDQGRPKVKPGGRYRQPP